MTTVAAAMASSEAAAGPVAAAAAARPARPLLQQALRLLGSMRLTVVLLVLLAALTWSGTLAQTREGIYYVQKEYFESWYVLALGVFPLPGAVPVLSLLFANLVVGGVIRLHWRWRNAGILVAHFGILLLLLAGFVKLAISYSGHLYLREGASGNEFSSFQDWELALLWRDGDKVYERVMPAAAIERATGSTRVRIAGAGLPFDIDVHHFLENCMPVPKGPMFQASSPVVNNWCLMDLSTTEHKEVIDRQQKLAGCCVTISDHQGTGQQVGILAAIDNLPRNVGAPHRPFRFQCDGRTYGLELRHQVWSLPFDIKLDKFRKTEHPGTGMARDFSSFVTVTEADGSSRQAHIYMNEPLRKDGLVFYQTSFGEDPKNPMGFYSMFEVANNPSDQWPKWACYVIALGLLGHFLRKLWLYLRDEDRRRQQVKRVQEAEVPV